MTYLGLNFYSNLINNFSELHAYTLEQPLSEIQVEATRTKGLYFGKCQVVWITIKMPIDYLIHYLFWAIATLLSYIGETRGYHLFTVLSKQALRDQKQLLTQEIFKERLLIPSFNVHQAWPPVYLDAPVAVHTITDPDVQQMTFFRGFQRDLNEVARQYHETQIKSDQDPQAVRETLQVLDEVFSTYLPIMPKMQAVDFASDQGLCNGAVALCAYLLLNTAGQFLGDQNQIVTIGKLFEKGMPPQAAILQALNPTVDPTLTHFFKMQVAHSTLLSPDQLFAEDTSEALKAIQDLPPGLYKIETPNHTFLYKNCEEPYLWDPSRGAIDLQGEVQFSLLLSCIKQYDSVNLRKKIGVDLTQPIKFFCLENSPSQST